MSTDPHDRVPAPLARAAFRPRWLQTLKGYNARLLLSDLGAGAIVGLVALPLAMAVALAIGLRPEAGIWTAIVAGLLMSLFGGSSVQIGGPAAAFIVIAYGIVERYGAPNLLIATIGAGLLLMLAGRFKLGALVRHLPETVMTGLRNGIAVLIVLMQVKDWFGLSAAPMPADALLLVRAIGAKLGSFNPAAFGLGLACMLGLFVWPMLLRVDSQIGHAVQRVAGRLTALRGVRLAARTPAPVVALVTLTLLAWALKLPVDTIGSRFGGISRGLPVFAWPAFDWATVKQLVMPMVTLALLGAIETMRCTRVFEAASGDPSDDLDQQLMAQGIANLAVPFVGGLPTAGSVALTAASLRVGARSPVAGLLHAATLLITLLLAAPLAGAVPLPVLAGLLVFFAWQMGDWRAFAPARLRALTPHDRWLLLGTFFLTVVFDLTLALQVGLVLAAVLFVRRMGGLFSIELVLLQPPVLTYQLYGALFFGAAGRLDEAVTAAERAPRGMTVVLDAMHLIWIDAAGIDVLRRLHRAVLARGGLLRVESLQPQPREVVERSGFAAELTAGQTAPTSNSTAASASPTVATAPTQTPASPAP